MMAMETLMEDEVGVFSFRLDKIATKNTIFSLRINMMLKEGCMQTIESDLGC